MPKRSERSFKIPVRSVAAVQAQNYLRKAESHLASALEARIAKRWDTAVLLGVHAVISAADAVCVATAGVRSVSPAHTDQTRLIRDLFPDDSGAKKAVDQLAAVLDRKNTVEYEARRCTAGDAEIVTKQAERVLGWARQVCGRAPMRGV